MFERKDEILAQLLAFIITSSLLVYFSKTAYGVAIALILGILATIITRFTVRGETPSVCIKFSVSGKISAYSLLAILYTVLLILLLSAHTSGMMPHHLTFFQEWGAIPIQNYILLVASIGATFFLPGYFILRVIDRDCSIRGLDALVFSFLLSYLYTPFMVLISLSFFGEISTIVYLSISLLVLTICIFIFRIFSKNMDTERGDANACVDPMLLITAVAFFVAALAFSKDYGYIAGFDVWRHQGTAISIIRYGLEAVNIPLKWFHVGLVFVFTLSGFPIVNSASVLNLLNIMPILAFYCMARKIFGEKNQVTPAIATMFFSLFSGFGWTYALYRIQVESWTEALARTASITANDTLFSNLWIWGHSPASVSFTAFLMLLYLLFCTIKCKGVVFALTLLTFLTGWALHAAEALIFVIMFGIILLFCQSISRSRKLSICLALIAGLFITLIAIQLSPGITFFTVGFWESSLLLVYLILTALLMFASPKIFHSFKNAIAYIKHNQTVHVSISILILFLWLLSFYLWIQEELTSTDIGFIPWYTYPMRLGVVGFFALLTLLLKDNIRHSSEGVLRHFATFLILAGTLFVFGKIITITKIYYLSINYWEIRILRYCLHAVVAVIAAMFALYLFNFIRHRIRVAQMKKSALSLRLLTAIFLALVIVVGTMSTAFTIDYWANHPRRPVTKDLGIATFALDENTLFTDQSTIFVGITGPSVDLLNRLGVKCVSGPVRDTIALTSSAETYYFGTWFTEAKYLLYVPEFDDHILKSNRDSFTYTNVLQLFDPAYENDETSIYKLPYGVPPTPNSQVLILLPTRSPYTSVLDAFAQMNKSYDVALPNALTNLHYPTIVLAYDPLDVELSQKLTKRVDEGATLVVFNVDKLGNIAEKLNLIEKDKVAPVVPVDHWRISYGEGLINTTMDAEQGIIMHVSGKTDNNRMLRADYILENPLDSTNTETITFTFKSEESEIEVRFALLDVNDNWHAYTLKYTNTGSWQTFKLPLNTPSDASASMNLSLVNRVRIGINGIPNTSYSFYSSNIEVIPKSKLTLADSIGNEQCLLKLPFTVNVPILNSSDAFAFYMLNGSSAAPFIIEKNYGSGRIIYINAMPLVNDKKAGHKILPEVLTWVSDIVGLPSFNWTKEDANERFEMYTKKASAKGSVNINSSSITFIDGLQPKIRVSNYSGVIFSIRTNEAKILPSMNATYAQVFASGPFKLLIFENENLTRTYQVEGNSTILMKNPKVSVSGETVLEKAYWRKRSGYWGRTLTFNGDTAFTTHCTSISIYSGYISHQGSFKSLTPHSDFVESYPHLEKITTTLCLSFIAVTVIITFKQLIRKSQNQKRYRSKIEAHRCGYHQKVEL